MVKSEIVKQLHQKHPSLNRYQIETIVDIFFDTISDSLAKGKPVEIRSLGRFTTKTMKENFNARNPSNNKLIYLPERKRVRFKMSKHLKQVINKKIEE